MNIALLTLFYLKLIILIPKMYSSQLIKRDGSPKVIFLNLIYSHSFCEMISFIVGKR